MPLRRFHTSDHLHCLHRPLQCHDMPWCAGPIKFESLHGIKGTDKAMLEGLRGMMKQSKSKPSVGQALAKLSLEETGLAKVL